MAVDEALLVRANDAGQMTLRFYQWEPATVSLGYFQQQESRQTHAASGACPLVRRATGGGAIVHDRELTYSLVLPSGNRWARSNQQVYDLVHEILVRSLSDWQIEASLVPEKIDRRPEPFLCFQRRAAGDVVVDQQKICGSAQRRIDQAILQHGSILLERSPAAPELPGLNDLGASPAIELAELQARLTQSIGLELAAGECVLDELQPDELEMAATTEREKFAHDRWNLKR